MIQRLNWGLRNSDDSKQACMKNSYSIISAMHLLIVRMWFSALHSQTSGRFIAVAPEMRIDGLHH